ncbi:MAG: hypothetical protein JW984_05380 [Deltaproteobacteria bacterium]|uniref:Glycosyl hydrolases family 2 sugar binding domain-containing protein n=1 Tax=Candidatus Zymogenus saltonus TaxID=2844893 RepID=A0A9D8PNP4_9DELT|nr:hypothetical protein [Candidatus Zymogenus saltonus]
MTKSENKIESLYARFENPPGEFSPVPFLFLNLNMDLKTTESIFKELIDKGIMGVVLHPRTGLTVKFASDEFWRRLVAIVNKAKELGMTVWLYDDYNWPSGTAAGRVIQEKPDFAASGLVFRYGKSVEKWEELIGAYSIKKDVFKYSSDIPKGKKSLLVTARRMTDSNFCQTGAPWFISSNWGALDLMNPDATDHFIGIVYSGFEKHLKKYFGNPIVGVFTDEPEHYRSFPWTKTFAGHFTNSFGYDIVGYLPSLIKDVGDFRKVRRDYYSLVTELTRKSYYERLRLWAERNGLLLTGHLGEEDFLEKFPHSHGSPYSVLNEMHVPGTDYLGAGHGYIKDEILSGFPNFNPKLVSAAARTKKSGRILCEIWGGSGWGYGPRSLKGSIDWGAALGINLFVPHAVHTSLMGLRKRDFPPSHFVQQPFWRYYKIFADYISRVSLITSTARRATKALLLFPITSLWHETTGMGILTKKGAEFINGIKEITDNLIRDQRNFDYLFEEDIESETTKIAPGIVFVGKSIYDTIIVPEVDRITKPTEDFLTNAEENGIRVIYMGGPSRFEKNDRDEDDLTNSIKKTAIRSIDDLIDYLKLVNVTSPVIEGKNSTDFVSRQMCYGQSDIYFFAYLGVERFKGTLTVRERGIPELWNPETGERYGIADFELVKKGLKFKIEFEPGESKFYVIHDDITNSKKGRQFFPEKKIGEQFLPRKWEVLYKKDNMMRIDNWRLIRSSILPSFPNLHKLWSDDRYGFRTKLSICAIRLLIEALEPFIGLRSRIRYAPFKSMDKDFKLTDIAAKLFGIETRGLGLYQKFDLIKDAAMYLGVPLTISMPPPGSEYEIVSYFLVDHIPDKIHLVWEDNGEPTEIYINGQLISDDSEPFFLWDRSNRRANLKNYLRRGKNRIGIKSRQPGFPTIPPILHGIEPIVITGNFRVSKNSITRTKNRTTTLYWGEKGTGNYSGTVAFRCELKIPKRFNGMKGILDLGDVRETVRVVLNGERVDVKLWPPYRFDVTDYIIEGVNSLEICVSNTAENLLGTPILSGIVGDPKLTFYGQKFR